MTIVSLYIDDLLHIMIWFLPLYCITRILWVRRLGSRESNNPTQSNHGSDRHRYRPAREIVMAIFVLFMLGLLTLTFRNGMDYLKANSLAQVFTQAWVRLRRRVGVNFKPFHTIKRFLRASNPDLVRINIIGNIVMFVPWGLGLPLLWKKFQSVWKVTLMSLLLPVCIESIQLFVGRTVDVDDVILNFAGGMSGGLLYLMLKHLFPKSDELAE